MPKTAGSGRDPAALVSENTPKYPGLTVVEELPKQPQSMFLHAYLNKEVQHSYRPPDLKLLRYFGNGLDPDQAQALQKSTTAIILEFAHPRKFVWTALRSANEIVEDVARNAGGLVWDNETREVFSPDAWHQKRLAAWNSDTPDISTQTAIHIYPNGGYARAITLGMSKVGLPDVVIEETPWSSENQVGNLINIFSQSLAESATLPATREFKLDLHQIKNARLRDSQIKSLKGNAAGVACLSLVQGKWEEGDPRNRLVQLASDRYSGTDPHSRQDAMFSSFFGWEDSMTKVHHNEQLVAASVKEKAKLPELRKAFNAGLDPGEFIQVKAPFRAENGDTEWMWVEVTHWSGNQITGLLENEPSEVTSVRARQVVQVREEDVFDYIRQYGDKRTEGNTTGEILRKMSEGEVAAAAAPRVPTCSAAANP